MTGTQKNKLPSLRQDGTGEFEIESSYGRAVENYVGIVPVPVGLCEPLRINGASASGNFEIPLATTEAALVASYSRGARCISRSGGCSARALDRGIGRAPAFIFDSLEEAASFVDWALCKFDTFCRVASTVSRYAKLVSVNPIIEANIVYLELTYLTGEAAGQNLVTKATEAILRYITEDSRPTPRRVYIEGNTSGDKKPVARALSRVRGRRTSADIVIPAGVLRTCLGVSSKEMTEYAVVAANGAVLSGAVGSTGHIANALAAFFIACGQDVACVAESAVGVTRFEDRSGALYASITLTSLVVGTVGGGTGLPVQRGHLDRMGLAGVGSADAMSEVCAALCLAGELSIAASICSGDFARAHRVMSRRALCPYERQRRASNGCSDVR